MSQCAQPISWLELERYYLGESSQQETIQAHIAQCASCHEALARIQSDKRQLPALVLSPAATRPNPWLRWSLIPALAVVLLFVWVSLPENESPQDNVGIKGGDWRLQLIRENQGELLNPSHFSAGDRFKAVLSCPPDGNRTKIQIIVEQEGKRFSPLPMQEVECKNELVIPGAFALEGGAALVCVVVRSGTRSSKTAAACVPLSPAP
jgi:hypothetical protein